jgi:hypothetical protein
LIKVHDRCDGDTVPMDGPPGGFQDMLTEFKALVGKPTYANSQKGKQTDFEIKTDQHCKILFRSPYRISPREEEEHQRQIDKAICPRWIQPSRSNIGSPILFMPKPDGKLRICIDYCAVNPITVEDRYPLQHIEDLLNSIPGSC